MALGDGDKIQEYRCGAAYVTWNGVELGFTEEGSVFKPTVPRKDFETHELGATPIDSAIGGVVATVKVVLVQFTIAHLKIAFPPLNGYTAGTLLYQYAKELKLHPRHLGSGDTSEDIVIFKAYPNLDPFEIAFKIDVKKTLPIEFMSYPDRGRARGANIGSVGGQAFGV